MTASLSIGSSFASSFSDLPDRGLFSKNTPTSVAVVNVGTWEKQSPNRSRFKMKCLMEKRVDEQAPPAVARMLERARN